MTAEVAAPAQVCFLHFLENHSSSLDLIYVKDEPVYCICRGPEAGFMVFCDNCEEWFHGDCVGIKKRQADKLEKYLCPNCAPPVEKNAKPSTPGIFSASFAQIGTEKSLLSSITAVKQNIETLFIQIQRLAKVGAAGQLRKRNITKKSTSMISRTKKRYTFFLLALKCVNSRLLSIFVLNG
jgi:hypothetical protein